MNEINENERIKKAQKRKKIQSIIVISITILVFAVGGMIYLPPMTTTTDSFQTCLNDNAQANKSLVIICENNTVEYCQKLYNITKPYHATINWLLCETPEGKQAICEEYEIFPQFAWAEGGILRNQVEGMIYSINELETKMCEVK